MSQMQYKLDLGARVVERRRFLERWLPAREEEPSQAFLDLAEREIDCAGLFR